MADPSPQMPAQAYRIVATVLPERYFLTPPPEQGVRLVARGMHDRIECRFDMDHDLAAYVVERLESHTELLGLRVHTYAGR